MATTLSRSSNTAVRRWRSGGSISASQPNFSFSSGVKSPAGRMRKRSGAPNGQAGSVLAGQPKQPCLHSHATVSARTSSLRPLQIQHSAPPRRRACSVWITGRLGSSRTQAA